jgi:hypothetical protein
MEIFTANLEIINGICKLAIDEPEFRQMFIVAVKKTLLPWEETSNGWFVRTNLIGENIAAVESELMLEHADLQLKERGYKFRENS